MGFQGSNWQTTRGKFAALATASIFGLVLSGCAGSVGGSEDSNESEGLPLGATAAEYQEALADMPETTLVYQPEAPSGEAISSPRALEFKKRVEEVSGGKLKIEIVWGQAVAGYSEVVDALGDGRVDIATILPIYSPAEFPVNDAFIVGSTLGGSSPLAGELASNAALLEVAWNSEEFLAELDSHGVVPLIPFYGDGNQFAMCSSEVSEDSGWSGLQNRVSSSTQNEQISALGASPVSLEYPEIYEALQRGTIDCAMAHGAAATGNGFLEVAPHYVYSDEVSFGRGAQSVVAGSNFEKLPLAAKQLIFDEILTLFEQQLITSIQGNINISNAIDEHNGSARTLNDEEVAQLTDVSAELLDEKVEAGVVPEGFSDELTESIEKWRATAAEMGLGDEGDLQSFSEWYNPETDAVRDFAEKVYDDVMAEHRPN